MSCSVALSARDIPGLRLDCVYFTNDTWEVLNEDTVGLNRDIGISNVKDGRARRFCDDDPLNDPLKDFGLQLKWPPPVWFTLMCGMSKSE